MVELAARLPADGGEGSDGGVAGAITNRFRGESACGCVCRPQKGATVRAYTK